MNPLPAILFASALLLTGCIGTHITMPGATDNDYNSAPPMPPAAETKITPKMSLRSSLVEPPQPWPMLTLAWDYDGLATGANVYHWTNIDMSDKAVVATVLYPTNQATFPSEQFGFVGVKAFNQSGTNIVESGWGIREGVNL